jgi:hypothetical protein
MYQIIKDQLEKLRTLPVKLLKLSIESILIKEIASYLAKFLEIFSLYLNNDILIALAFTLVATIVYYIITTIYALLFGKRNKYTSSSSSCSSSRNTYSLCSSKSIEIPSVTEIDSSIICTSCTF